MSHPSVVLCSLVLNEMEWLERSYAQHKDWPGLKNWVFVEAADRVYAETNPSMVNEGGLSVDGTTEFLLKLWRDDPRISYVPHGLSRNPDPAQGKIEARSRYINVMNYIKPNYFVILDGDEFYTKEDQGRIYQYLESMPDYQSVCLKFRHPWRPPSLRNDPLFQHEVVGGFWKIAHCHVFRWSHGVRYSRNHNTPEDHCGTLLNRSMVRANIASNSPSCVHMAFSSSLKTRRAKHKYYQARGEGNGDVRGWYVESRKAWEEWHPARQRLPKGVQVVPWQGPIPECFQHS